MYACMPSGSYCCSPLCFVPPTHTPPLIRPPPIHTCVSRAQGVYRTYVSNAKFVSSASAPHIAFMSTCIVELWGLDMAVRGWGGGGGRGAGAVV